MVLLKTSHGALALGFLHSRTNLSPFTKDFRGGDQFDEYLTIFLRSGLSRPIITNKKHYHNTSLSCICYGHAMHFFYFSY